MNQVDFFQKRQDYKADLEYYLTQVKETCAESKKQLSAKLVNLYNDKEYVLPANDIKTFERLFSAFPYISGLVQLFYYMYTTKELVFIDIPLHDSIAYERVHSSEEIFDFLKQISSVLALTTFERLECEYSDINQLKEAFTANDRSRFIAILDSIKCDKSLLYCFCERNIDAFKGINCAANSSDDINAWGDYISFTYQSFSSDNEIVDGIRKNLLQHYQDAIKRLSFMLNEKATTNNKNLIVSEAHSLINDELAKLSTDIVDYIDVMDAETWRFSFEKNAYLELRQQPSLVSFIKSYRDREEQRLIKKGVTKEDLQIIDLTLPPDFFKQESIPVISELEQKIRDAGPEAFAKMINILVKHKILNGRIGNLKLVASLLSGRKVETSYHEVEWGNPPTQRRTKIPLSEKVMLWLTLKLYPRSKDKKYDKAYEALNMPRSTSIKPNDESSNASNVKRIDAISEIINLYAEKGVKL